MGDVPAHWQVLPNRALFREVNERNRPDEPLLSVTINRGIIPQKVLLSDSSKKDSSNLDKSNYKLVKPGDIAYNKMRAWQGAIGVSEYRGIVSPAYVIVRPRLEQVPRYYHYLFRTPGFIKEAQRWSYGITSDMWSLRYEDFKRIYSVLPPPEEQRAIARFLDYHDRLTRRYIRAQRRLIALLEEQKQALIQRAVTRGLDPDVRLKPSGVEWLGEIPEHWKVVRLKSIANIRYGLGQPPRELRGGVPLLRATNVKHGEISNEGLLYIDPTDVPQTRDAFLTAGEIIVVRSGAYTADSAIVPPEYEGAVAGYDMVVTARSALPQFVALALLSKYVLKDQLYFLRARAAQPHLNAEELGGALILLPPYIDQSEIAQVATEQIGRLDSAVVQVQRQIDLIREYRTRLIADVVTGKLDVRGVALPEIEPDEIDDLEDETPFDENHEEDAADAENGYE